MKKEIKEKYYQGITVSTIELDEADRQYIKTIEDYLLPTYPRMYRGGVPRRAVISFALQKAVEEIERCRQEG